MTLERHLSDERARIIRRWREEIVGTYPSETQRFLRREKDPFSNPVGHILSKDVEILFDEVVKGRDQEKIRASLDHIIRIRAVQEFKPSHAVAFVLRLKRVIKDVVEKKDPAAGRSAEMRALDDRIDDMALLAFDVYSECRQKLYDLRVNETRNQVGRLLERANLLAKEVPAETPGDL